MSHGASFALDFSSHWSAYAQHKSIVWLIPSLFCEIEAIYLIKNYNCCMWVRLYWARVGRDVWMCTKNSGMCFCLPVWKASGLVIALFMTRLWRRITKEQFFSLEKSRWVCTNILNWFRWKTDICNRAWNKTKIYIKVFSDHFVLIKLVIRK